MDDARVGSLVERLRSAGFRVTTARRALLAALVSSSEHVTADDLTARVQAWHPDVHESTIYRCLEALEDAGLVEHTHLGHGRAIYHLSDDAHQHLVCESCGHVVEVPDSVFTPLADAVRDDYGFILAAKHFALAGRCSSCA